jgi:hypothetical protein
MKVWSEREVLLAMNMSLPLDKNLSYCTSRKAGGELKKFENYDSGLK